MIWQLDVVLLLFAVACALWAIMVRDLLASVILLGAFSLFMCLLWVEMGRWTSLSRKHRSVPVSRQSSS